MKTNEGLARRWMESKHWGGWRVGMVSNQGGVCCTSQMGVGTSEPVVWADTANPSWVYAPPNTGELPDLDHPGTRAFLREDVKRAFEKKWGGIGDSSFEVSHGGSRQEWRVEWRNLSNGGGWMLAQLGTGHTEEEALIAALESAPE